MLGLRATKVFSTSGMNSCIHSKSPLSSPSVPASFEA